MTAWQPLADEGDANADRSDSFAPTTHESNMLEGTYNGEANTTRAPEPTLLHINVTRQQSKRWEAAVLERLEMEQAMAASMLTATMPYDAHVRYQRILEAQVLERQNQSHIARAHNSRPFEKMAFA